MKKLLLVFCCFLCFETVRSQESALVGNYGVRVYFEQGSSALDPSLSGNGERLNALLDTLRALRRDTLCVIESVRIAAGTSPDGRSDYNKRLSQDRTSSVAAWLREHASLPDSVLRLDALGIDWAGLTAVVAGTSMKYKDEVFDILRYTPEWIKRDHQVVDGRKRQLQRLHGGEAWFEMSGSLFPRVRNACIDVKYRMGAPSLGLAAGAIPDIEGYITGEIYVRDLTAGDMLGKGSVTGTVQGEIVSIDASGGIVTVRGVVAGTSTGAVVGPVSGTVVGRGSVYDGQPIRVHGEIRIAEPVELVGVADDKPVSVTGSINGEVTLDDAVSAKIREALDAGRDSVSTAPQPAVAVKERVRIAAVAVPVRPVVAVKTNLLYDAGLLPNVGVEVPLKSGWTLGADWLYAWWGGRAHHRYWRACGGDLEVRKYFGRRAAERPMTGHHLGLYGQMTTYDFRLGGNGYLNDRWSWGAGIEYGYSLPIARRLNLDFGLGIGYLGGEYETYRPADDCYVWQATRKLRWFVPTKAEVSLVWLIGNRR